MKTIKSIIYIGILSIFFIGISCSPSEDEAIDDGNKTAELTQAQEDFINQLKTVYPTQVVSFITDYAEENGPYAAAQKVTFTFSSSGMLFIDINPDKKDGDELELPVFSIVGSEYIWQDEANDLKYALSLKEDKTINEVNVNKISDNTFYAQLLPKVEATTTQITTETSFRFASTNKDCKAFEQSRNDVVALIHVNTEKCNNEVYRPTLSLSFGLGNTIKEGTYTLSNNAGVVAEGQVYISASDIMNPKLNPHVNWVAIEGTIEITKNEDDVTKLDVEFKSVKMENTSYQETKEDQDLAHIPETDILTGFIVGI